MAKPDGATEEGGPTDPRQGVNPLERTAPIYVEASNGYVDIRQVQGDPTLYTPEEAREIARDVLAAADAYEHDAGAGEYRDGDESE